MFVSDELKTGDKEVADGKFSAFRFRKQWFHRSSKFAFAIINYVVLHQSRRLFTKRSRLNSIFGLSDASGGLAWSIVGVLERYPKALLVPEIVNLHESNAGAARGTTHYRRVGAGRECAQDG